jgi:plastocyanin
MKIESFLFLSMIALILISGCLNQGVPLNNTINIQNGSFQPNSITIPVGTTITWNNHNGTIETVTADGGYFDSEDLAEGYEFRYTFLVAGKFSYYSKNNPLLRGNISVASPNGIAAGQALSQISTSQANASSKPSTYIDLAAKNIAFDKSVITVPAGAEITIAFNNQDVNIPHNFAVYGTEAAQKIIFQGSIITGPAKTTYTFKAPDSPGNYFFRCDVHPTIMKGQFVVVKPGESLAKTAIHSPSNASKQSARLAGSSEMASMPNMGTDQIPPSPKNIVINLIAKNIAFNTSTITVPAGSNVTIKFDNQDSRTPHNFAVYDTEAAQQTIFQGKIITGPAKIVYNFIAPDKPGTYFFRCDVHPTIMKGQFIVQPSSGSAATPSTNITIPKGNQSYSEATATSGTILQGDEGPSVLIKIKDYAFDPGWITIPAGTTVVWRNYDPVPHTATSTTEVFDSGIIESGKEFRYTLKNPGSYSFYCTIHPQMNGIINVTSPHKPQPKPAEVNPSQVGISKSLSSGNMPVSVSTTSPQPPVSVIVDLLAKDMNFDKNKITVLAASKVYINFYNLDVGVPHNFAVYTGPEAIKNIFEGQIIIGPAMITYGFDAPIDTGTYFFRCDVHPKVMTGDFYVVSSDNLPSSPTGQVMPSQSQMSMSGMGEPIISTSAQNVAQSGQKSVVIDLTAQNIAFDKSTITVPAGTSITVNFDNRDSGVPHNFAVYYSEDAKKVIFQGKIITGPDKIAYNFVAPDQPGTYFFRCDVHPTQMKGKFVVQKS